MLPYPEISIKMTSYQQPDASGHFGPVNGQTYGGSFVAETLVHALDELNAAYAHYSRDPDFIAARARFTMPTGSAASWAARRFFSSART